MAMPADDSDGVLLETRDFNYVRNPDGWEMDEQRVLVHRQLVAAYSFVLIDDCGYVTPSMLSQHFRLRWYYDAERLLEAMERLGWLRRDGKVNARDPRTDDGFDQSEYRYIPEPDELVALAKEAEVYHQAEVQRQTEEAVAAAHAATEPAVADSCDTTPTTQS